MEEFFKNVTVFDSWFHERVFEPMAAVICRWLSMSRRNLVVGLFAIVASIVALMVLRGILFVDEQTENSLLSLIFASAAVVMFGSLVLTLSRVGKGEQLPIMLEVYLHKAKQLRPFLNLVILITLVFSLITVAVQPEKFLPEVLDAAFGIFFVIFFHSLDSNDLSKS